ncbi:MAG: hypothetical protein CVV50_00220 [Spirochaetae bacterium HGW-Spirochaetae-6]|nr:MAG: hypothetical protein CVV50_00220 [Spirochaetae bacterium HGW-Spirochaetae-6]
MRKKIAILLGLCTFMAVVPLSAQKISDFLKGKKGDPSYSVTIRSNPAATVFINGENKGRTQLTISLKKGEYQLRLVPVNARKFEELETQINISSNQSFDFQLPKKGIKISDLLKDKLLSDVRINANVQAKIYINGEDKGIAPATFKLRRGNYQLRLAPLDGSYEEMNTNIVVNQRNEAFTFSLRATTGYLRVNLPRGAALIINNQVTNYTPGGIITLPAGAVNVTVKYYALEAQQTLQIQSGQTLSLGAQLLLNSN